MQQPPHGRPPYRPPGGVPPGAPPGRQPYPPPGAHPPPTGPPPSPAAYAQAHGYPGAPAPAIPPAGPPRKRRGSLRFLASTCVFSAWLTLIASILMGGWSFVSAAGAGAFAAHLPAAAPAPGLPNLPNPISGTDPDSGDPLPNLTGGGLNLPGGGAFNLPGGGAGGGGGALLGGLLGAILPGIFIASGVITIVSGVVTFVLFLGLGQACYALLDLEEQSYQQGQLLQQILARLSMGR